MPRSIQIYLPPEEYTWWRELLETLANEVITDEEAGQRGAKISVFIRMLATGYTVAPLETIEHLQAIKALATNPPWKNDER